MERKTRRKKRDGEKEREKTACESSQAELNFDARRGRARLWPVSQPASSSHLSTSITHTTAVTGNQRTRPGTNDTYTHTLSLSLSLSLSLLFGWSLGEQKPAHLRLDLQQSTTTLAVENEKRKKKRSQEGRNASHDRLQVLCAKNQKRKRKPLP
ncbi:hypothetical protein LX32DRAFT_20713 [Colletotrichum zoysiae]|uniref:Uncharacterized protein n=1 Tax=Colletotrichum zoysiae TaxID=1216348 RepID=A0AAD9HCF1_9PEZI|nr:hypothetical protein LX32DRAFT_20713 [Colletotrichum zoysiae]